MTLRLWHSTIGVVCGALAMGNFLRLEDEGPTAATVGHLALGFAWLVLGAWTVCGPEE